jgi:hypothetical protein
MNSKSKIILGLSAILAVSAGVAATSTFAWFSTSRTTSVSITGIGVKSNSGNLWCVASTITNGGITIATGDEGSQSKTPVLTASGNMYDVSGDGLTFYQPKFDNGNVDSATGIGTKAHGMTTVTNTATTLGYRTFQLTFHNGDENSAADDPAVALYVDTSSITAGNSDGKSTNAAACTRIAILDSTATNLLFYWQQSSEADTRTPYPYTYIHADSNKTTEDGIYHVAGFAGLNAASLVTSIAKGDAATADTTNGKNNVILGSAPDTVTNGTDGKQTKQKIISQIDPNGSVSVVVRIWCEGTDTTCSTAAANGGKVDVSLGFAAL